jgi:hypothetical protein
MAAMNKSLTTGKAPRTGALLTYLWPAPSRRRTACRSSHRPVATAIATTGSSHAGRKSSTKPPHRDTCSSQALKPASAHHAMRSTTRPRTSNAIARDTQNRARNGAAAHRANGMGAHRPCASTSDRARRATAATRQRTVVAIRSRAAIPSAFGAAPQPGFKPDMSRCMAVRCVGEMRQPNGPCHPARIADRAASQRQAMVRSEDRARQSFASARTGIRPRSVRKSAGG